MRKKLLFRVTVPLPLSSGSGRPSVHARGFLKLQRERKKLIGSSAAAAAAADLRKR
jgi:hypothetical protein